MIREVARCPYCGEVSAGIDDDRPTLVMAPDRAGGRPCLHPAIVLASLEAYRLCRGTPHPGRTAHWPWLLGEATRRLPGGPAGRLSGYVALLAFGPPVAGLPATERRAGGGT